MLRKRTKEDRAYKVGFIDAVYFKEDHATPVRLRVAGQWNCKQYWDGFRRGREPWKALESLP
jgi:hypothetical protein